MDKLYALQKNGEDIKLPSGFQPKIDAKVIIDQLTLYRDNGFGADVKSSDTQKQNVKKWPQDGGSPAMRGSPSNTSSTNKQAVQKVDTQKQSQDSSPSSASSNTHVPRTDMRRQWQDPESPPGSSKTNSENKGDVPRTSIQRNSTQDSPLSSNGKIRRNSEGWNSRLSTKRTFGFTSSSTKGTSNVADRDLVDTSKSHDSQNSKEESSVSDSCNKAPIQKKGFAAKLAAAAPYNFFLTAIRDSPPTHREPLSVCFHQLLDPSMGDLDSSLQINFMVELDWLMEQYKVFGNE